MDAGLTKEEAPKVDGSIDLFPAQKMKIVSQTRDAIVAKSPTIHRKCRSRVQLLFENYIQRKICIKLLRT